MDYGYERFSESHYDLNNYAGPRLGEKAPDFTVFTLTGTDVRLLDFDAPFLVLELGSITCPLFQSRRDGMAGLVKAHPDLAFDVLYVREAHPGHDIAQHASLNEKIGSANRLAHEDGETRRILIDDLEGTAHTGYGGYPNSVFIINRNGCVVYFSDWNNPRATGQAVARLLAGRPAGRQGLFLPAKPPVALKTLRRAGAGAGLDFLRSLPAMFWKNAIRRNVRALLWPDRPVAPDQTC